MANHVMSPGERMCLHSAAHDLRIEFRGIFSEQTIETLLLDSHAELAAHASVTRWLALGSERLARQRLRTFARAQIPRGEVPIVLFVSRHNAGRSQMALGWLAHLAGDRAVGWSGGSDPMPGIDPAVVAVMAEAGIDISLLFPKPWTDEFVLAADVVVTMGGDACPLLPGRYYEDWELGEPAGKTLEEIRSMRDQIKGRVMNLVDKLPEALPACRTVASLP